MTNNKPFDMLRLIHVSAEIKERYRQWLKQQEEKRSRGPKLKPDEWTTDYTDLEVKDVFRYDELIRPDMTEEEFRAIFYGGEEDETDDKDDEQDKKEEGK